MTINAELGEIFERTVAELVSSGRYSSKSEVLREGVRLLQVRDAQVADLDAAIARSVADADAGRVEGADAFLDRLDEKYRRVAGE